MRRRIDFMQATKEFNTCMNSTQYFSREQIKNILKRVGLPYSDQYFTTLRKENLLVASKSHTYRFTKAPIHYLEFQKVLRVVHTQKYSPIKEQPVRRTFSIEEAIALLKRNNYIIFKPC